MDIALKKSFLLVINRGITIPLENKLRNAINGFRTAESYYLSKIEFPTTSTWLTDIAILQDKIFYFPHASSLSTKYPSPFHTSCTHRADRKIGDNAVVGTITMCEPDDPAIWFILDAITRPEPTLRFIEYRIDK